MVLETLAALATAGATTVVGAMATDAWDAAKSGIAALFGRGGPQERAVVEAQLERHAGQVAAADDAEAVRRRLAATWQAELESLLAGDPDAAGQLRALIALVHDRLPQAERAWVQTNIARDHGHVFAVQGGNLVIHQAPSGTPGAGAESATGERDESR